MSSGLINIGNTCAINSLLQCILHSLNDIILIENIPNIEDKYKVTNSLMILLKLMKENEKKIIKPRKFINDFFINNNFFIKGNQLDASELWIYLSNKIFQEIGTFIKEKYNYNSIIHQKAYEQIILHNNNKECFWSDIYQGVTMTITKCNVCDSKYYNFETFYNLSINVEKDSIINSLIDFFSTNNHNDDWKCEMCNKCTSYKKTTKLWKLPKILVISLNRFDNKMNKINKKIFMNHFINFKKGVHFFDNNFLYQFKSCIHHFGLYGGGHYISSILNNNKIIQYDDSNINKINYDDKFKNSNDVYLLFYTLKH
jgi:ubiquitin C-terminal hydrolase